MDYFFHADTSKYRRRLKAIVITTAVPLFGICVFCAVNIAAAPTKTHPAITAAISRIISREAPAL